MLAARTRLAGGRGRCLLVAAAAVGATGLCAGPALAAPVWNVTMTHANPFGVQGGIDPFSGSGTSFSRESTFNTYTIKVENTGTANVAPVTVVDQLPEGMVLGGKTNLPVLVEVSPGSAWSCNVLPGAKAFECTTEKTLEKAAYDPITAHVDVMLGAANPSTNVAKLCEGALEPGKALEQCKGSAVAAETPDATTVLPAVPFGIASFGPSITRVIGVDGEGKPVLAPDRQAGHHPFSVTTEILYNYTTSNEGGQLVAAGGGPKEVQVEVPPGFLGNPENIPRCPLGLLRGVQGSFCPAKTAVGYTTISLKGRIEKGKANPFAFSDPNNPLEIAEARRFNSVVYNMEPAPGFPAAFGFVALEGVPFVLEAKVRTGDYGVTVGDSASAEKVLGANTTLCENGVEGENPAYRCRQAPPSSKPFLTNPTQCSSAPIWTLQSNPWDEPADQVSRQASANTQEECSLLSFQPKTEFKPTPPSEGGTTQADEPTGMALDLVVPQTNTADVLGTPQLKNFVMTLPEGLTASPSAADGLAACSKAQFGLGTEFGDGQARVMPARVADRDRGSLHAAAERGAEDRRRAGKDPPADVLAGELEWQPGQCLLPVAAQRRRDRGRDGQRIRPDSRR